jgi:hypothetical protein
MHYRAINMKTYKPLVVIDDKFTIKALLCNTKYIYIFDSEMYLNNTQIALLCFNCNSRCANSPQFYVTRAADGQNVRNSCERYAFLY